MQNSRTILICDNDYGHVNQIQSGLEKEGYDVHTIDNASELIPLVIRLKPAAILVNPDMNAFNEYDVCKNIMKGMNIPLLLLIDSHSTHRDMIDECRADDVVTKPVEINNLLFLISKHVSVQQQ